MVSLLAMLVAGLHPVPAVRPGNCPGLEPNAMRVTEARPIAADDLLRLRDVGQADPSVGGPSPLSVSPDGRQVAFLIRRADPEANAICHALAVVDLAEGGRLRVIDRGGEPVRAENIIRGSRTGSGLLATIVPAWSPDGRQLAYLKRVAGRTQIWRVAADGSEAIRVTDAPVDVEDVAWSEDGERLVFATRPGRLDFASATRREGRDGFLYDERMIPPNGFAPQLPEALPRQVWTIPAAGGEASPGGEKDAARLPDDRSLVLPHPLRATSSRGRSAGLDVEGPSPFAERRAWAEDARGERIDCRSEHCAGSMRGIWWHPDAQSVLFLRYEGERGEFTSVFRWDIGAASPRRLLSTDAALVGCTIAARALLCLRESVVVPRHLVALDLDTAEVREILDLNPEFSALETPRVERIRWRNGNDLSAWADLVLPPGSPPDRGWPMVIVQYHSRGFLRGGTGDEYPVHALAANGIAVFSFQRPPLLVQSRPDLDEDAVVAAVLRNWSERGNTHDSLKIGMERAFARGDIDPDRVGITGLSDGSTTARYAMVAGMTIRAAALSTCCRYNRNDLIFGGPIVAENSRAIGFPPVTAHDPDFYAPISIAQAADRLTTPVLMQLSDDEALFALETFASLREHEVPVEMRVFPGEHHIKWQPAHRQAIYQRNIDWFRFWLLGEEDADAAKQAQYARWRGWRDTLDRKRGPASGP